MTSFQDQKQKYSGMIARELKKNPNLSPAYVKTVADIESTYGTDTRNRKLDAGKRGYTMGITRTGAAAELKRLKIPFNVNTTEGAIAAAISYSNLLQSRGKFKSDVDLYMKYNGTGDPKVRQHFIKRYAENSK